MTDNSLRHGYVWV